MSERGRTALLVISPQHARTKEAKAAADALEAGGVTLLRRECQPSRLAELIQTMKADVDCVVLGGGDGLYSAGAIALRDTGLPLGLLPLGPTNELARNLGVPLDPAGSAHVILAGAYRTIPLGSVNGRPFFTVASVGMTIENAAQLRRAATGSMAGARYLLMALQLLFERRRFSAIVRCGAVVHRVRTMQITIGNGRLYSGGMHPGGQGAAEPGLAVYSLEPKARLALLFLADLFRTDGTPAGSDVRVAHSPVVEVVTRLPLPICADGEVVTVTPARFSVLPKAVHVYAPAVEA